MISMLYPHKIRSAIRRNKWI
ncbi:unnamed protein product [Rotaria sp. Silwood2]|nr:unnamed protein product [Rotaria sp. Silwood2]